jgi:uncharacterized phage-associated protein
MARLKFRFDSRRAAEAASRFTELAGGTIDIVRLMKMLYLAERRSLELYRHPMFGDRYVSMKHGPVVSHSYNLLKADPADKTGERNEDVNLWATHFVRDGYMVRLQQRLAPAALSRADIEVINCVHEEWRVTDTWAMVEKLHKSLAEWKDPGSTSTGIAVEDICIALKLKDSEVQDLRDQVQADMAMAQVLQD